MLSEVLKVCGAFVNESKTLLTFGKSGEVHDDLLFPLPPLVPLSKIVGIVEPPLDGEFRRTEPNLKDLVKGLSLRKVDDLFSDEDSPLFASNRDVTSLSSISKSVFELRFEEDGAAFPLFGIASLSES